ncbi:MAG: hypothetical protein MUO60_02400 [Clostridiaceae bacterium]|nr:hypothetical protein [Clostridiaceae bacterium]
MNKISYFLGKLTTLIAIYYIQFVYKTSKVISTGQYTFLKSTHSEKNIIMFWHGDSYSLYPYHPSLCDPI